MAVLTGIVALYGTGLASVTQGTKDVTFSGSTLTALLTVGVNGNADANYFTVDKINFYKIAAFVSATAITLVDNFAQATVSGVDYAIVGNTIQDLSGFDQVTSYNSNALYGWDINEFDTAESWG